MRWANVVIDPFAGAGGSSDQAYFGQATLIATGERVDVFVRDCPSHENAAEQLAREMRFRRTAEAYGLPVNFAYVEQHGSALVFEKINGERFSHREANFSGEDREQWRTQVTAIHDLDCIFKQGDRHGGNVMVTEDGVMYAIDNVEYWGYSTHQVFLDQYDHRCDTELVPLGLA